MATQIKPIINQQDTPQPTRKQTQNMLAEVGILAFILILAAYFRLMNLENNPHWYPDEGTWLEINRHWLHHESRYLAFEGSILISARLPMFGILLAGISKINGAGIESLRLLTALLGILSVGLVFVVLKQLVNRGSWFPVLAAMMLAIYPKAVLYSRIGFSYNLLAPLVLMILLGLWKYLETRRRRWLCLSLLMFGIGTITDLAMFTFLPALLLVILWVRWRDIWWGLPLAMVPFALFVVTGVALWGQDFWYDLRFAFSRTGELPLIALPAVLSLNYYSFISRDPWVIAGLIGLFMLPIPRLKTLILMLFLFYLIGVARTVPINDISHYLIPLFPLVAIGAASLVWNGTPHVFRMAYSVIERLLSENQRPTSKRLKWLYTRVLNLLLISYLYLVVVSPFLINAWITFGEVNDRFHPPFEAVLVAPRDAQAAAAYINNHVQNGDVVLASPTLASFINGNVADFQIALAAAGESTKHFPDDLPAHRFAFDPRYTNALYVVIDPVWRNWGVENMENVKRMVMEVEQWPRVFHAGEVDVYRNPDK